MTVRAAEDDPRLPEKVDFIFMCDTLHYIDGQEQYVKTMAGYLKEKGAIAVISFRQAWPPMSKKFTGEDLAGWMKSAGLTLEKRYDFIQDEYLMIFRR